MAVLYGVGPRLALKDKVEAAAASYLHFAKMRRKEQREREKKRAEKTCQTLEGLGFLSTKRPKVSSDTNVEACVHEVDISTAEFQIEGTPPSSLSEQEKIVESHASCSTPRDASLLDQTTRSDNDIGAIFKNAGVQTGEECQKVVDKLSDGAKYALLKQHRCSPDQLLLPRTFLAGCKRSFQRSWMVLSA